MDTKQFLDAIHKDRRGYFTLNWKHAKYFKTKTVQHIDTALEFVRKANELNKDVWFSVNRSLREPEQGQRIKVRDVTSIPGFWADIDIAGPGHETEKALPGDITQAMALIVSPEPTIIVNTGGGIHAYWLFNKPWEFDAADPEPARLCEAWHKMLAQRAAIYGWHIDNVSDLARVLRVPGTVNHKLDYPRTVDVIGTGPRYPQDYLTGLVDLRPTASANIEADTDVGWAYETIAINDWTHCQGDKWARPGKDCRDGLSAQVHPWGMYVYSDAADLPRGWHSPRAVAKFYDITLTHAVDVHHEQAVEKEAERMRVRNEARDLVNREMMLTLPLEPGMSFLELEAATEAEDTFRVAELLPSNGRVLLAAVRKTGKTTLGVNLVRSLVDGAQFLGEYDVVPVVGKAGIVDLEMAPRKLFGWYKDAGIKNLDKIWFMPMRGKAGTFNILDEGRRLEISEILRDNDVEVLLVDPIRPLTASLGLDENSNADMGRFLDSMDALMSLGKLREMILVHHAGHEGSRPRGASTFGDWPDAIWYYSQDADGTRFMRAEGRDVDMPSRMINYDPNTRRISAGDVAVPIVKRGRDDETDDQTLLAFIAANPDSSLRTIIAGVDMSRERVEARIKYLEDFDFVRWTPGAKGAHLYKITDPMDPQQA